MKKSSGIKIFISVILVAAIAVGIVSVVSAKKSDSLVYTPAIFKEEECVHIKDEDVEISTLIYGTHLIHLSALDGKIYEAAEDSASQSGQSTMYYKSELAGGTWFDVTTAESIHDISEGGTAVDKSVIEALFVTHHTKSDGITYDLRTGAKVSLYDLKNPYDHYNMEELSELKAQYEVLVDNYNNDRASDADIIALERLTGFYNWPFNGDYKAKIDAFITDMQRYLDILKENKAPQEDQDMVNEILENYDSMRREYYCQAISDDLNYQVLPDIMGGEIYIELEDDEETNVYLPNADITAAIGTGISALEESIIEYQGKEHKYDESNTVMANREANAITRAYDSFTNGTRTDRTYDEIVEELVMLTRIMNDNMIDATQELKYIDGGLLSEIEKKYKDTINKGINEDYRMAVANDESKARIKTICETAQNTATTVLNELEFIVDAKTKRMSPLEGADFCHSQISVAEGYKTTIPSDAFHDYMTDTVDSYITWLKNKESDLLNAAGITSETDNLAAELEELQEEMMELLDEGDLDGALAKKKEAEKKAAELEKKNSSAEKDIANLNDKINNLESLIDNKEKLDSLLDEFGDKEAVDEIARLRKESLDAIDNYESISLDEIIRICNANLKTLETKYLKPYEETLANATDKESEEYKKAEKLTGLALKAVSDIKEALENLRAKLSTEALDEVIAYAASLLEKYGKAFGYGTGAGDGTGTGSGDGTGTGTGTGEGTGTGTGSGKDLSSASELFNLMDRMDGLADGLSDISSKSAKDLKDELDKLKKERDDKQSGLSDGSAGDKVKDAKDKALDAIDNNHDELDAALDELDGLMDISTDLAYQALKDVNDKLTEKLALDGDDTELQNAKDKAERLLTENYDKFKKSRGSKTSESELLNALDGLLDSILDGATDVDASERIVIEIAALEGFADVTSSVPARNVSLKLTDKLKNEMRSPLVYERFNGNTGSEYVPTKNMADYVGKKYYWDNGGKIATIAKNGSFYIFKWLDEAVTREQNDKTEATEKMSVKAELGKNSLHIPEDYTSTEFDVEARYITKSDNLAVLVANKLKQYIEKLEDALLEMEE